MADTRWDQVDGPVLQVAHELLYDEEHRQVGADDVSRRLGWGESSLKVARSLRLLFNNGYVSGIDVSSNDDPDAVIVTELTEKGFQTLGEWRRPDQDLLDVLIAALEQSAEEVDNPEEASRLKEAAAAVGRISRDVAVGVLSSVIVGQFQR